ncbi:MAG TPA: DinB family protein [Bacillota bacterium]|nr:DinB family protein [Bacillota bacterium]
MRIDLATEGIADPQVALLFAGIAEAYRRLKRQVSDMTQAELEYRGPSGDLNSTATLIAHLAYVDLTYLHSLKGEKVPPDLDRAYGPFQDETGHLPEVRGKSAAELLERYAVVQDMIRSYLAPLTAADLERTQPSWNPQDQRTTRWLLVHMAWHSAYHQGHITWLKAWARKG